MSPPARIIKVSQTELILPAQKIIPDFVRLKLWGWFSERHHNRHQNYD